MTRIPNIGLTLLLLLGFAALIGVAAPAPTSVA
jgi:hypothetical protein